jgi:hypothetical protein
MTSIDYIIDLMRKYTITSSDSTKELDEADAAPTDTASSTAGSTGGGTASSGKTPKKWSAGIKDGPARGWMADSKHIWTTGRPMGKTYMGPKYSWTSGRAMGKTGGSDYA